MAFLVVEIEIPNDSVTQINQNMVDDDTKPHEGVEACKAQLEALLAGAKDGQVLVAVRSTTSTPTASGGSMSATFNLK